ncbi:MAG: 4-alpha-glucanotransferase, partial [Clostridia bacterium]|nr:4-alpha-glucanotransferase [Clostridia bacterium]
MERASGVLMHISSLYGKYSCGAFSNNAKTFIDNLKKGGFKYWQVLPFCITDDYNSPYKSYSAFSGNPNFIDLERLYEDGLITKTDLDKATQLSPYLCEFDRLKNERIKLLFKASKKFTKIAEMNEFYATHKETLEFCKFMALKDANNGKPWYEWSTTKYDEKCYFAWQFIEYVFYTQWLEIKTYANNNGIKIIGDIPIYVDHDSADVWANPSLFQLDKNYKPKAIAGVPPDYFSADGQVWGNPLYNYKEMKKDGYAWWKKRIAFTGELFDAVRIDHFRAIETYYAIPYGDKTAKNGKWVKGPGMSLINEIKKVAKNTMIIAEDLGEITDDVRKLLKKSGFPGMRVLQFAFMGENSTHLPHNYVNNTVAYTGTHDNNTLLGYIWELDEQTRHRVLEYFDYHGEWDNCYDAIIKGMMRSTAGIVVFPIQDLLKFGADTRLNTPGNGEKNW